MSTLKSRASADPSTLEKEILASRFISHLKIFSENQSYSAVHITISSVLMIPPRTFTHPSSRNNRKPVLRASATISGHLLSRPETFSNNISAILINTIISTERPTQRKTCLNSRNTGKTANQLPPHLTMPKPL